jgi:hypothetical protein
MSSGATRPSTFVAVLLSGVLLALGGCAQHARVICEPLALVYHGDVAEAVTALDATKVAESSNDRFLYHTMRGQLLELAGDYDASNVEFEQAVAIADALEPWSVTGTLADYTVNEVLKDYVGEDYERAYVHYYLALNYLAMNDLEGALVECRRLDEVFRALDARYEEGTRRYQDDGFIRYLSGLVYEAEGKLDDALIDYHLALDAYRGEVGEAIGVEPPAGLVESAARLDAGGGAGTEIVVIVENGWAPYKEEESIEVPIYAPFVPKELQGASFLAALVKIAYPAFVSVPAPEAFRGVASPVGAGSERVVATAERAQDMDALARWTLERRIGAVKFRSTLRATAKQIAIMRAKHESKEDRESGHPTWGRSDGWFGWLLRIFVEDVATSLVAETEQADTRSWVLLPRDIWIARIPVEPGEYEVLVEPDRGARETLGRVTVGPGEMVFRMCRIFGGPHPIRCEGGRG